MDVKLRRPRRSDLGDFVKNNLSYYEEVKTNPEFGLSMFRKKPAEKIVRKWAKDSLDWALTNKSIMVVAEVDGRVVGRCDVSSEWPGSDVSHVGSLSIAIIKDYRGMEIGTMLLKECLKRCGKKFKVIYTEINALNTASKKLVAKFGFKKTGMIPFYTKRRGKYSDDEIWTYVVK